MAKKQVINVSFLFLIILSLTLLLYGCKKRNSHANHKNNNIASLPYVENMQDSALVQTDTTNTKPNNINGKYKYTWTGSSEMPPICIIIDDFGYVSGSLLEEFGKLPQEIAFAILPDLKASNSSYNIALKYGHDVLIHIPMEAKGAKIKPGSSYISLKMDNNDIDSLITYYQRQFPLAIGANNHMGSSATEDKRIMKEVIRCLNNNNLFFVDSATTSNTVVYSVAESMNLSTYRRDIFLDVPDITLNTLKEKINNLNKYRGRKEPIIIISHCHNKAKLDYIRDFIAQIRDLGLRLVPISSLRKEYNT